MTRSERAGLRDFLGGAVMAIIGLIVAGVANVTRVTNDDRIYVLAGLPIVFGIVLLVRGVYRLRSVLFGRD